MALLLNGVHVVDDNHLLYFGGLLGTSLAKGLHFVAEIANALLLLQIVDKEDIAFLESLVPVEAVILANQGIEKGGFAGGGIADNKQIELTHVDQRF